ncbi:hypothetical protein [Spirosoma areae]
MKTLFTRKALSSLCLLLLAVFPWACADHNLDPNVPKEVTCSCQIIDNSGPTPVFDTKKMMCPGGRFTCKCGDLAFRGAIVEFKCN